MLWRDLKHTRALRQTRLHLFLKVNTPKNTKGLWSSNVLLEHKLQHTLFRLKIQILSGERDEIQPFKNKHLLPNWVFATRAPFPADLLLTPAASSSVLGFNEPYSSSSGSTEKSPLFSSSLACSCVSSSYIKNNFRRHLEPLPHLSHTDWQ